MKQKFYLLKNRMTGLYWNMDKCIWTNKNSATIFDKNHEDLNTIEDWEWEEY